jgi:hypothetical protein
MGTQRHKPNETRLRPSPLPQTLSFSGKELLTRDRFREEVFRRDQSKCVICGAAGADAHHIIERRLFGDSAGYYLNNGATLCPVHHLQAEQTVLTVEEIRQAAGIPESQRVLLPQFYGGEIIDKWGNPFMSSGMRMRGELFQDPNIQKVLREAGVLDMFTKYVKYPRTQHLPFSPGAEPDDLIAASTDHFVGRQVVITEKLDGENMTLYGDYLHARSLSGNRNAWQSWIKNFHARLRNDIPIDWRVCGEYMYAAHSIQYADLASFFYVFSIWDESDIRRGKPRRFSVHRRFQRSSLPER